MKCEIESNILFQKFVNEILERNYREHLNLIDILYIVIAQTFKNGNAFSTAVDSTVPSMHISVNHVVFVVIGLRIYL